MNVEVTVKHETTKQIGNSNCKVTMLNGDITAITVRGDTFVGEIEFQKNFVEFERFVRNCLDVFHSVLLEQNDERRNTEQGTDGPTSEKSVEGA